MKKYINWAKLLNPFVIIVYSVTCYYLANLARYGGVSRRAPVIIITLILLLLWVAYSIYKMRRQRLNKTPKSYNASLTKISRWWSYFATLSIVLITFFTGYHIYQSAIPYNGKLSWYIQAYQSEREVVFEQNNIYEDGLNGLIEDVNKEVELPEELYIAEDISLTFTSDGQITDFDGFLYGKDDSGETKTFLISYDDNKSENLEIHLDNYLEATYDEDKLLQPLIEGLASGSISDLLGDQTDEVFHLTYNGFETRMDDFEPTYYYDEDGFVDDVALHRDTHVGYSFVIHFESIGASYPLYFIAYDPFLIQEYDEQLALEEAQEADPNYFSEDEIAEEYFLNEEIGYQLVMLDAMLGSRFYGLRHSVDGGQTWEMLNPDPFLGSTGVAAGLTFIDENLGFIILSHNGGAEANLFRTADGGQTFERVELPPVPVVQNDSEFEPFDFPELPSEEGEQLTLYVNQGIDSNYLNDARALFVSNDEGLTFDFVEIE